MYLKCSVLVVEFLFGVNLFFYVGWFLFACKWGVVGAGGSCF